MTRKTDGQKCFLTRLLHNEAGNVLAMTAAATFPLMGMVGGAVDMARIYAVKSRLQAACDAGALAGRRVMGNGAWADNGGRANTNALRTFDLNFKDGAFGAENRNRAYTESDGTVTGVASAQVPMTLMRLFGQADKTLNITCESVMRIPNTDVMFVLDNSGSMACLITESSCSNSSYNRSRYDSKLSGLQRAVKCFYEALAKQDITDVTPSDCGTTSNPSGGLSNNVQLRFGFVNYDHMVSVGKLLPNDFMVDSAVYQSRKAYRYSEIVTGTSSYQEDSYQNNRNRCLSWASGSDTSGFPTGSAPTTFTGTTYSYSFVSWNNSWKTCTRQVSRSTANYTKNNSGSYYLNWTYEPVTLNVSGLKAGGSTWNNSVNLPLGPSNSNDTVAWDGCIQERKTFLNTDGNPSDDWVNYPSSPTDAIDMDIDRVPTTGNDDTRWAPALPTAIWGRYDSLDSSGSWGGSRTTDAVTGGNASTRNLNFSDCGVTPSRRLTQYTGTTGASNLQSYVNTVTANGNTYHDIGLLWGARLMSPTGIFSGDNATTPGGAQIQRHMIFMTDGDTANTWNNYASYGIEWWDRRQISPVGLSSSTFQNRLEANNNARTEALCTAIKNRGITLWVISYGSGVSGSTTTRLRNCATSTAYYFHASNTTALITQFRDIADKISQLRLTN